MSFSHGIEHHPSRGQKPGSLFYLIVFSGIFLIAFIAYSNYLLWPEEQFFSNVDNENEMKRFLFCPVWDNQDGVPGEKQGVFLLKNLEELEKEKENPDEYEFYFSDYQKKELLATYRNISERQIFSLKLLGETKNIQIWEISYGAFNINEIIFKYAVHKNRVIPISYIKTSTLGIIFVLIWSVVLSAILSFGIGRFCSYLYRRFPEAHNTL